MNLKYRRVMPAVVSSIVCAPGAMAGYQTIALQGDEAPGTGGVYGNLLGTASVDANGELTFWSTINGVPSDQNTGAFRTVNGVIEKFIQEGDTAPGIAGTMLQQIGSPYLSASGAVAIPLRLATGGGVTFDNDWGLWTDTGNGLELVAREGTDAPNLGGAQFERPGDGILSPGGNLAFFARLREGTGDVTADTSNALWRKTIGGDLELIVRESDATPGIAGGEFNFINTPDINDAGVMAFTGSARDAGRKLRGEGINFDNDNGIWMTTGEGLAIIAREGDSIPGLTGFRYGGFSSPSINASGSVATIGGLTNDNAMRGQFLNGIFVTDDLGDLVNIAKSGDSAPGAGGAAYRDFLWAVMNDDGDIAYGAYTDAGGGEARGGEPPSGLWRRDGEDGSITPIAVTGDTAPDSDGAMFDFANSPVINGRGDVVFRASLLLGDGVDFDNNNGIWAYLAPGEGRGAGGLMKVAREGDLFDVAPGDTRTIEFVDVQGSGVESFEPTQAFNDSGQLAVRLRFTDGTGGVFLFQVPSPGSGAVLGIAGIMAMCRRR